MQTNSQWDRDYRIRYQSDDEWAEQQPTGAIISIAAVGLGLACIAMLAMLVANTCFPIHRIVGGQ